MPRSKRNQVVSLTATTKKPGRENNERLFAAIQESVENYPNIFIFAVDNMRNTYLKDVRNELSDSRLFFGKTKVMSKALGATKETELRTNLSQLASHLAGSVGLLFTPRSPADVKEYFDNFSRSDFARMNHVSPISFTVPEGVVYASGGVLPQEYDTPLPHSLEVSVRGLGMPTKLVKGKVWLDQPYEVVKEGKKMDSKQAALLKTFGQETAEFRVRLVGWWEGGTESVTLVEKDDETEAESMES
ncbi:ribosomal protein L10-domain-containing protein [Geopyxis carbonaria]|nr:ribosomal protein L10-domain-containing protein [Geopyxis carbonaria]